MSLHWNLIAGEWIGNDPSGNIDPSETNDIRIEDHEEALAVGNFALFSLSSGIAAISVEHATYFERTADADMVMVTASVGLSSPFSGRKGYECPRGQGKNDARLLHHSQNHIHRGRRDSACSCLGGKE